MIPIILDFILALLQHGPAAIEKLVQIGEQTNALTPDQAQKYRSDMEVAFASQRWQTDNSPTRDPLTGTAEDQIGSGPGGGK